MIHKLYKVIQTRKKKTYAFYCERTEHSNKNGELKNILSVLSDTVSNSTIFRSIPFNWIDVCNFWFNNLREWALIFLDSTEQSNNHIVYVTIEIVVIPWLRGNWVKKRRAETKRKATFVLPLIYCSFNIFNIFELDSNSNGQTLIYITTNNSN